MAISISVRDFVIHRAHGSCEYCGIAEEHDLAPFCIDHILAQQHRGPSVEANLAWSCFNCNSHKGPNIAGIDPDTGDLCRLYNPRLDSWDEHFFWTGGELHAKTPIGRVTVYVLGINSPVRCEHRRSLIEEGFHPFGT